MNYFHPTHHPPLSLTTPAAGRLGWESAAAASWPPPLESLRTLSLTGCGLRGLPPAALAAFPSLTALDLSGNPDLGTSGGGGAAVADAAAAAAALPMELCALTALAEVRIGGSCSGVGTSNGGGRGWDVKRGRPELGRQTGAGSVGASRQKHACGVGELRSCVRAYSRTPAHIASS